ncbi:MAG: MerR family transcriptional regulator [Myxococcales bacterium]|nr:MerR family transcriptional regulator [Myxococcales bacterium]
MASLRIGELAREAGVSIDAIRFYERRGVLDAPARTAAGYRVYTPAAITRLRAIKRLQRLGFTLDEVKDALSALAGDEDGREASCDDQRWRLEAVLARVDARLAELQRLRGELAGVLDGCRDGACELADSFPPASG